MAAKKRRKPWLKFPKRMQKKLIVMFSAIAVLLTGLIGRLMYIEYTSGDKYEKIVLSQQEYDSQTSSVSERRDCGPPGPGTCNQYRRL